MSERARVSDSVPASASGSASTSVPACPGCHFACPIDDYQCARGEHLHAAWERGEELPVRQGPGRPPQGASKQKVQLSSNERLMHLLHIVGIALQDLERESGSDAPDRQIVDCLMRHERAASERIVLGRTQLDADTFHTSSQALIDRGFVETKAACGDDTFYALTEAGIEQAGTWRAERQAAEAEFLGVLTDDEKQQFHDLVFKILEPGFKRRARDSQPT